MKRRLVVLKTDPTRPDRVVVTRAAAALREGELVVAPTDTRYGLLGRVDRPDVLRALFRAKQRPLQHPSALFIRDFNEAANFGAVTREAALLASRLMPGPVTLVLRANSDLPPPVVVDNKIGLRCSSSQLVNELLSEVGVPLTATSANISGRAGSSHVKEITEEFQERVTVYIDGGELTGPASTVIDCSGDSPCLLREGAIAWSLIERILEEADA